MSDHLQLFSSESVTEGHPDKIADQISDAVLDAVLSRDPTGRVACEALVSMGLVILAGEITTTAEVDFTAIARRTIREIGYTEPGSGFKWDTCAVLSAIGPQSPDIALGVDTGGAGDQGLMFGYACQETPQLMPLPITLAHGLTRRLAELRRGVAADILRPDGKAQVTVAYDAGSPVRVHTVVVSTQHSEAIETPELTELVVDQVIRPTIPAHLLDGRTNILVNPTGRFVTGGPMGDCGLTGRKIIVDTYGGVGSHGGGAFSGKDPTKVDRSASYMARHVAKNLVAAGLAERALVQLAYAIGVAEPVSVHVETWGTAALSLHALERLIRDTFDLTPRGIIRYLDLLRPIYRQTATYGHFGREEKDFTWERIDRAAELRAAAGLPAAASAAVQA